MKEPAVTVIVLNWNGRELLLQCLESLNRLDYSNYSILVVDNGSSDGSAAAVREAYSHVQLLTLPENLGYARGNNAGLSEVLRGNPDWIMFLNNDTEVDPQLLTNLITGADRYPDGGIFGPKIYYGDVENLLWYAGGRVSLPLGRIDHRGIREPDQGQYDIPGPTDFVSGCCLLAKADLMRQLGGFDTVYPMYVEDVDLCYRAGRLGALCYYLPEGKLWHHLSSSMGGELSLRKVRLKWRSSMRFFRRFAQPYHWGSILLYQLLYFGILGPARYIRRKWL
ncbi:MAG: glycosyltransferase family 2 protein [Fidelibacterota bacterium]|nr:MAG: glycosyltransferase family 2 protein [Candidatus Neomarinimicrobiota bacterium]